MEYIIRYYCGGPHDIWR